MELLLLGRAGPGVWAVVSADGDVFIQCLVPNITDVERVLLVPTGGGRPNGCAGTIRRFDPPPKERQQREWRREGKKLLAAAAAAAPALGSGPAAPLLPEAAPGSPTAPRASADAGAGAGAVEDPDRVWVFAEDGTDVAVGDPVPDLGGAAVLGHRGLVESKSGPLLIERVEAKGLARWVAFMRRTGAEAGAGSGREGEVMPGPPTPREAEVVEPTDARVLPVAYNRLGQRRREWGALSGLLHEVEFDSWPVAGPRTTNWVATFFRRRGCGPEDHHRWWRTVCRLNAVDWGVGEHMQCCRYMEVAGTFDQLDLGNVAVLELIARRLQTIEFQYRERVKEHFSGVGGGAAPGVTGSAAMTLEESELFDGADRGHTTLCCCPSLVRHVTEQLRDSAEIQKQARKAREEQAALRHGLHPSAAAPPHASAPVGGSLTVPEGAVSGPGGAAEGGPDGDGRARGRGGRRRGRQGQ